MVAKASTSLRVVSLALAIGVVFATPLASAFGMGTDASSVDEMKDSGATPQYGQTWVGRWMKTYGWGGFESDLRTMRDAGVTPVIQWYYYGDSISPNCVQYGCDGRTKSEWDAMAKELATRAKAIMGSKTYFVVMEPEFQKNGIQHWETFDGHLENQAKILKANGGSGAKVVVGFGHWGNWERFDRAVEASHYTGFQVLRGSTRDSSSTAIGSADYMIDLATKLKNDWGKPIIVFDFGIATYGGWEWVQEKALREVIAKRAQLDAVGIQLIVWRYVYDNDHSSGYFGAAESTWGVKTKWGSKKAGYDELVTLIKNSPATSTSTTTTSTTSSVSGGSTFSDVKGNEWWIEAKVAGSPTKVEARVDGGSWVALAKKSWGAWAVSTKAPTGSVVELRATYGDGTTTSAAYRWPDATPTTATSSGSTSTVSTGATAGDDVFSGVKGNEWWIQAKVSGSPTKVEARVDGGSWVPLSYRSWGAWAVSTKAPTGSVVELRATYADGSTRSASYDWPSATPTSGGSTGGSTSSTSTASFDASFRLVKLEEWWTQVDVTGEQTIVKVDARVNGGTWVALEKKSYGHWAESFRVPSGSRVEFRATASNGAVDHSSSYTR